MRTRKRGKRRVTVGDERALEVSEEILGDRTTAGIENRVARGLTIRDGPEVKFVTFPCLQVFEVRPRRIVGCL